MAQPALSVVQDDEPDDDTSRVRIWTAAPHALVQAIDDYHYENRFKTRSATVRHLIELGLDAAARRVKNLT